VKPTAHFIARCAERGISQDDVQRVLDTADERDAGDNGNVVLTGWASRGRRLTVVVTGDHNTLITAYYRT